MHPSQQHQPTQQYTQQWPPPPGWQPPPPPKKNRGVRVALALGGVLLAMIVIVVAVAPDRPAARSAKPTATRTAEVPAVSAIPRPDAQQAEDLLYGLRRIDKELDRARSIDRARDSCSNLLAGEKRSVVVEKARQRFDGVAQINTAEARKIVALIEAGGWCQ